MKEWVGDAIGVVGGLFILLFSRLLYVQDKELEKKATKDELKSIDDQIKDNCKTHREHYNSELNHGSKQFEALEKKIDNGFKFLHDETLSLRKTSEEQGRTMAGISGQMDTVIELIRNNGNRRA